jgi:ribosomal protein S2
MDLILGHSENSCTIIKNRRIFYGIRNKRLLYNYEFLFINFFKKSYLIKKLIDTNSEFIFLTAKKEFFFIVKKYADLAGCRALLYLNTNDINSIFDLKKKASINSPVFLLFNNDNGASYNCINELVLKRAMSISIIDTNSIGGNYFHELYGNDDSVKAISFYAKLLSDLIIKKKESRTYVINKNVDVITYESKNDCAPTQNERYINKFFSLKKYKTVISK